MKRKFPSIEKYGIVSGLSTGLALILYFIIMNALGYAHIIELRFFNFVILAIGICIAVSKYKKDLHERDFYLQGWGQGIYTTTIAVVFFGLFMAFYLGVFDTDLLHYMQRNVAIGQKLSGFTIFLSILLEGMAGGFVITLAAMQYFKSTGRSKSKVHPIDHISQQKNKGLNY